jgi:uncharacterized protein (TIGR00303 family)
MIKIYTQQESGQVWLQQYRQSAPMFACILGFTATGLIPGISAAGATPEARQYTALADAEFLIDGAVSAARYPLPPLKAGVSPVYISRAVVEALQLPVYLFNAGLPHLPPVPHIDLGGVAANCLTTGRALPLAKVRHLYQQGKKWGEKLAARAQTEVSYLLIGECVVGGTTTALAILTGLGIDATGKVNSSHPQCNHQQKALLVRQGLTQAGLSSPNGNIDPLLLVAAVGDPMQIVAAGMAIAASRHLGVMLAGGTQMLAVWALIRALSDSWREKVNLERIVVGTTRWVAEDPSGDTVGLAQAIGGVPLLATQLSFAESPYPQLRVYERGYVKEGVGAGGCAIAAHLYQNWSQAQLLNAIESLLLKVGHSQP